MDASGRSAYAASWYSDTAVSVPERGPLLADIDVDVCVVGAGLAGLTTARELALRYAAVCVVANHAAGRGDSEERISMESIADVLETAMDKVRVLLEHVAPRI